MRHYSQDTQEIIPKFCYTRLYNASAAGVTLSFLLIKLNLHTQIQCKYITHIYFGVIISAEHLQPENREDKNVCLLYHQVVYWLSGETYMLINLSSTCYRVGRLKGASQSQPGLATICRPTHSVEGTCLFQVFAEID